MATKIGINGAGRIGKCVMRLAIADPEIEVVAINDLCDTPTLAHLIKYDSIHGNMTEDVTVEGDNLVINGHKIRVFAEKEPKNIPWDELGVEIVIDCTGKFRDKESCLPHLKGSVKKVIISAPAKHEDITIVMGVNEDKYDPANHHIISNASCTTNCLAPFAKVLLDNFGIKKGLMTTVHSYTNDQRLLDTPHKDLRRARAAAESIIPTTTGAAKAVALVIPELKGKLNGYALRVPTPNVSVTDLVVELEKPATKEEINEALRKAANGPLKGILGVSDVPLVSKDFNGDARSSIVDADLTMVMEGNLAKVVSWYDNEWGYSCRLVDLSKFVAKKGL